MHTQTAIISSRSQWTMPTAPPRRSVLRRLATVCAALVFFAALAGGTAFAQGQDGGAGSGDDLDLREANVTDVEVETNGTGAYRFSVTLIHDDDGEEGYANWWQVDSLAGEQLGRRELLHAHGTVEFTRSETIQIPSGTTHVVIRGHDQTHGYGGQAVILNLESGDLEFVMQGSEPTDFSDRAQ